MQLIPIKFRLQHIRVFTMVGKQLQSLFTYNPTASTSCHEYTHHLKSTFLVHITQHVVTWSGPLALLGQCRFQAHQLSRPAAEIIPITKFSKPKLPPSFSIDPIVFMLRKGVIRSPTRVICVFKISVLTNAL